MAHRSRRPPFALVPLVLAALAAPALADEPLSPRNANYTLEVRLDPEAKTLDGKGVLHWRNIQQQAAAELRFHLYWNAFRNDRSTWLLEDRIRGRSDLGDDIEEGDWGSIEVGSMELLGIEPAAEGGATAGGDADAAADDAAAVDLTPGVEFIAPDDGNPMDRTVIRVPLPRPVGPGETAAVAFTFHSKVPRTFARTGFRDHYFLISQWFPKLGVFEPEGWNCHQFHAATEFFSDYGVYDVTITLPEGYVLGATGREVENKENGDGTVSHRYVQADVHGFTWTTSPDYRVAEERFEVAGLPQVDMRLLYQPEHAHQVERHFAATRAALQYYGQWYGAYPYDHITVVDPAWGSGAGGMEYPTLFTCGTRIRNPLGGGSPEGVTIHEAGHQFWYAIVGNNEFEYAWLDEGLNTFSTARVYDVAYGEERYVKRYLDPPGIRRSSGFLPVLFDDVRESRMVGGNRLDRFLRSGAATADPQGIPTYLYHPGTASQTTYSKTAMWLSTLENYLGWDTLQRILFTHFERYKFHHPRPDDFFAVADEVSGQDLDWFFDQVNRKSVEFEYAVESAVSFPAAPTGFVGEEGQLAYVKAPKKGDDGEETVYRSEVVVRRKGGGIFPVDVLMVFEDGSEARRSWDGSERWKRFVEERPSKLDYAVVDPDRVLLMDLRYTNNSRLREAAPKLAAVKWGSKWMVWLQDLLATFASFV